MRKRFSMILVVVLLSGLMCMIGSSAMAEKRTIVLAGWEHETLANKITDVINQILERENTGLVLEYLQIPADFDVKVSTMIAGGTPPDLMLVHPDATKTYGVQGRLLSLEGFLAEDAAFSKDDLFPGMLAAYTYGGELLAVPELAFPWVFFYNKDIFDEAGVAYPDATWTWKGQFLEAAKKLTKDVDGDGIIDIFGYDMGLSTTRVIQLLLANGGGFFSPDGQSCIMDEPGSYEALQFLQDLTHKYNVMPTSAQFAGVHPLYFFIGGRAAMYYSGFFVFERVKNGMEEAGVRWGVAPLPLGTVGRAQGYSGQGIGILRSGKNHKDAWEVAKLFAGPELAQEMLLMYYSLGCNSDLVVPGTDLNNFVFEEYGKIMDRASVQILIDGMNDIVTLPQFDWAGETGRIFSEIMWDPILTTATSSAKEACIEGAAQMDVAIAAAAAKAAETD